MANLLYKLGMFSARRAWLVITAWMLILAATVGLMVNFAGKLSTSMSLPGTPSQLVIDDLKSSFPAASNGTGQAILHKTNGFAFNAQDKEQILQLLDRVEKIDVVGSAQDPFATDASLERNRARVAKALEQMKTAPSELVDAQKKLDSAKLELDAGQAKLDAGAAKLDLAQKDLEAKLAQVDGVNIIDKKHGMWVAHIDGHGRGEIVPSQRHCVSIHWESKRYVLPSKSRFPHRHFDVIARQLARNDAAQCFNVEVLVQQRNDTA